MHDLFISFHGAEAQPALLLGVNTADQDRIDLVISDGYPVGQTVRVVYGMPADDPQVPECPAGFYVVAQIRRPGAVHLRAWREAEQERQAALEQARMVLEASRLEPQP